jgi:1-acyl-sn-glycerol-3-phosphate acyltransferase
VAETRLRDTQARAELRRAITALSVRLLGEPPGEIVLVAPGGGALTVTREPAAAQPYVMVANHASFADGLILILCLPEPACFAVAGRFATHPLTGPFLRRIGCQFVHGGEPARAAAETRRLAQTLSSGRSLAIWPEGGLDPAPGLRVFHLGAFEAAVNTGAPVVPGRHPGKPRSPPPGHQVPRWHVIHVGIGEPVYGRRVFRLLGCVCG